MTCSLTWNISDTYRYNFVGYERDDYQFYRLLAMHACYIGNCNNDNLLLVNTETDTLDDNLLYPFYISMIVENICCWGCEYCHYTDVTMGTIASQITSFTIVYRLFRRRSKKTSKLRVTGLCVGNSTGTGEFPAQMASNAEKVSIWWRHHGYPDSSISTLTNWRSQPL